MSDIQLFRLSAGKATVSVEEGFSRDVREIGHWGTGDLELTFRNLADLDKAKPLLERSNTES